MQHLALEAEALVMICVCGLTLYVMQCINPNMEINEYYKENNQACYVALELALVLVLLCFAINCRFLAKQTWDWVGK